MQRSSLIRRATASDVARLAGVSQTTVSYIINAVPTASISEETRARVHAAIKQLDYHPHGAARNLSRKSTNILGVSIPNGHNPWYQDLIDCIEVAARRKGYETIISITNFDMQRERHCVEWLKEQRMDGLIIATFSDQPFLREVRSSWDKGYPITIIGNQNVGIDQVMIKKEAAENLLIAHLVSLGHRRIGHIYGVPDQDMCGERLEHCLTVQQRLGLPSDDAWIRRCGPGQRDAYQATLDLLRTCPPASRPTALVVINDFLTTAVLLALQAEGISVPRDMSVGSFDNTFLA